MGFNQIIINADAKLNVDAIVSEATPVWLWESYKAVDKHGEFKTM